VPPIVTAIIDATRLVVIVPTLVTLVRRHTARFSLRARVSTPVRQPPNGAQF
jgi:hypothetical protein